MVATRTGIEDQPSITIGIPFYKAKYFDRALASVVKQSSSQWRVIVSDNGSAASEQDEVLRCIGSYSDPRIVYSRSDTNLGMVGNWNRVLDLATTDLVTILHSDDELCDNYCAIMTSLATKYPQASAFFCRTVVIDDDGQSIFSFPDWFKGFLIKTTASEFTLKGEAAVASLLKGNYIFAPTLCYRKAVIGSERFSAKWQFVPDFDFILRLLVSGHALVGTQTVAFRYRRHSNSITSDMTHNLRRFEEESSLLTLQQRIAEELGWTSCAKIAASKRIIKLNLAFCMMQDLLKFRFKSSQAKMSYLARLLYE